MGKAARAKAERWRPMILFEKKAPATAGAAIIDALHDEIWGNHLYTCYVRRFEGPAGWGEGVHLSIKREDREPIHDWRDLQRIKTEILGPEVEAVELYPAESRHVDAANQYHLWAFPDLNAGRWPFGFEDGLVAGPSDDLPDTILGRMGARRRQREFRPGLRPTTP